MTTPLLDPVELARELVRRPSVTPEDRGALGVVADALAGLGFACHRLEFSDETGERVANLYARLGEGAPNLCFAGHTDVVSIGDAGAWHADPFAADIRNGHLFGRGAADMKGAIAGFLAAVERFLVGRGGRGLPGSISLLITGDEEGRAVNGTAKVLAWMAGRGERIDACLIGEPTSVERVGDTIKIGRRGSLVARLTVSGEQGHSAYPRLADNPIPRLLRILVAMDGARLDDGTEHFEPSHLEIVSVDVGNPASNLIPGKAQAVVNIRYNDRHDAESLARWLRERCEEAEGRYELVIETTGEVFLSPPGPFTRLVAAAALRVTGEAPALSTAGGTSDGRFLHRHAPVAELGLVGGTAHKADENVPLADLDALARIYEAVLDGYFAGDR